jgi:hypothetical protein
MTVPTPRETEPGGHDEAIKEVERLRDQVAALKASIANADVASSGEAPALPTLDVDAVIAATLLEAALEPGTWAAVNGREVAFTDGAGRITERVRARLASPPQEERPT